MSNYYKGKRSRNLFDPLSKEPFKISRSKLDLFMNCPRCFYIDRRLGLGQPPGYPFNLNSAVDALLKKEFDHYRERQEPHPLFVEHGLDLIPFQHEKMDEWRDSLRRGITFSIEGKNIVITGGVDDVWLNTQTKEIHIADYKATSKNGVISLDADWQIGYKRQAEVYQWLFRKNGFNVSNTAYFVYCNGKTDRDSFNCRLEFDVSLIPYVGNSNWVDQTVNAAYMCLTSEVLPNHSEKCDFCTYSKAISEIAK